MKLDEAKKILEEQGYLVELFGMGKKKEQKSDDNFYHLCRNPSPHTGLIWRIMEEINIDNNGEITKAQALNYIKDLIVAIKSDPKAEVYEKVVYDVIKAIR